MVSARTAEYLLISPSQNAALNQSRFSAQDEPLHPFHDSSVVGAKYVENFKNLPLEVQKKIESIVLEIAEDVLVNIFQPQTSRSAFLNFRKSISRFQILSFKIIEILREASLISKLSRSNLALFSDLEEYLNNNPDSFDRRTSSGIIEIIEDLRDYERSIVDLVLHRKESLQQALMQVKYDEFLKAIYGAYLVIVCVYVFLEAKRQNPKFVKKVQLGEVLKEGGRFAKSLHDYVKDIVALMNGANQLNPENYFSTRLEYAPRIDLPQRVESYLRELELGEEAEVRISEIMTLIGQHLRTLKLEHRVWVDLFTDAEDPDWRSLMIVVEIAQPLQKTFNELEPLVEGMLEKYLPKSISDNIFIRYESLRIA